ncbi:hypothetical protein SNE40_002615 [Patella caerulea]|uniref:X-box-binding protein 1 n=1 Tax=Patella caerulea TaxID=87958 RepID=A0AAN8K1E9_PATCE
MSILTPRTIVITTSNGPAKQGLLMDDLDEMTESGEPRKRRRLTHLTPDEKFLRRKLKNRVAAQTARDRKKAQMSDMEIKIAELEAQNRKLEEENITLKIHSDSLVTENHALKERLGQCGPITESGDATSNEMRTKSPGSAASAVPLPKEQISTSLRWMEQYQACAVILSMLMCSVYYHNVNKPNTNSRKRKQPHPVRLIRIKQETTQQNQPAEKWWGPHQQSWNPSMN